MRIRSASTTSGNSDVNYVYVCKNESYLLIMRIRGFSSTSGNSVHMLSCLGSSVVEHSV